MSPIFSHAELNINPSFYRDAAAATEFRAVKWENRCVFWRVMKPKLFLWLFTVSSHAL
jgi:hypothetical protein